MNMLEKVEAGPERSPRTCRSRERTETGFVRRMQSIGDSGIPFDDRNPFVFGDVQAMEPI